RRLVSRPLAERRARLVCEEARARRARLGDVRAAVPRRDGTPDATARTRPPRGALARGGFFGRVLLRGRDALSSLGAARASPRARREDSAVARRLTRGRVSEEAELVVQHLHSKREHGEDDEDEERAAHQALRALHARRFDGHTFASYALETRDHGRIGQ